MKQWLIVNLLTEESEEENEDDRLTFDGHLADAEAPFMNCRKLINVKLYQYD